MTLPELCSRLDLPRTTVIGWLDAGLVGCYRDDSGRRVFSPEQIMWVEAVAELSRRGVSMEHMARAARSRKSVAWFLEELAAACDVALAVLAQGVSGTGGRV